MPFKSKAQMRYMFSQHPKIAKRWAKKYGVSKNLPEKKGAHKAYLYNKYGKKGGK